MNFFADHRVAMNTGGYNFEFTCASSIKISTDAQARSADEGSDGSGSGCQNLKDSSGHRHRKYS